MPSLSPLRYASSVRKRQRIKCLVYIPTSPPHWTLTLLSDPRSRDHVMINISIIARRRIVSIHLTRNMFRNSSEFGLCRPYMQCSQRSHEFHDYRKKETITAETIIRFPKQLCQTMLFDKSTRAMDVEGGNASWSENVKENVTGNQGIPRQRWIDNTNYILSPVMHVVRPTFPPTNAFPHYDWILLFSFGSNYEGIIVSGVNLIWNVGEGSWIRI